MSLEEPHRDRRKVFPVERDEVVVVPPDLQLPVMDPVAVRSSTGAGWFRSSWE